MMRKGRREQAREEASGKLSDMLGDFLRSATDKDAVHVYMTKISQMITDEGKSLIVEFGDILKYNSDLANRLLLEPDSSLASFRIAAYETMRSENALFADRVRRELRVRIRGIPDLVPLRKLDTSFLDRMLAVSGIVVETSEIRPLMTSAAWVCQNGHLTYQDQEELMLKRPPRCELCGEKRLELDGRQSRFTDYQKIRIQEIPEEVPPGQPSQSFDVNLDGDLVNTVRPGDRVVLTGIMRAVPDHSAGGSKTRLFKSQIDCNYIEKRAVVPSGHEQPSARWRLNPSKVKEARRIAIQALEKNPSMSDPEVIAEIRRLSPSVNRYEALWGVNQAKIHLWKDERPDPEFDKELDDWDMVFGRLRKP
jgi:replicative DNA helicase Mcm